jgi:hypothetical protein
MTTKLTLTIDEEVIKAAKKYASQNGKSISDIVGNYLKSITKSESQETAMSPKVSKLMGIIDLPPDFDYKKELGNIITKKQ